MPAHVAALYRYPLKGGTPELLESAQILANGRIAGDRVLALRFADVDLADETWGPKQGMLVLMNTPGLARLQIHFHPREQRLTVRLEDETLANEGLTPRGRSRIAQAMAAYALAQDENPLRDHPERLPLKLIGDGVTPRYVDANDAASPEVTLHGRGSLQALAAVFNDAAFSEMRFRSNIIVEGLEPWEEQAWVGGRVRIGAMEFRVPRPKARCLATHANPLTGERDRQVMTTLTHAFDQKQPTFAVALSALSAPGTIRVGDRVDPSS